MAEILTMLENQVLSISFNRADKMNAITRAMYGQLADELNSADQEFGIRAVILTSEGDHFTAGNDITDFLEHPPCCMAPHKERPPAHFQQFQQ